LRYKFVSINSSSKSSSTRPAEDDIVSAFEDGDGFIY
jgi:hypothetical protein